MYITSFGPRILIALAFICLFSSCCHSLPVEFNNGLSQYGITVGDEAVHETGQGNVCTTPECNQVSAWIKKAMNETANPCEDFYEYACGQWITDHPVPKGKLQISSFTELRDKNNEVMKESLVTDDELNNILPIMKVRTFFRSCLNKNAIDRLGKEPLKHYIETIDSWSVDSETHWDGEHWNVFKTLKKIQKDFTSTNLFFTVESIPDPFSKNEEKQQNILMIDKAPLDLHPIFFLGSPKTVRMLWQYMTNITALTGVDMEDAKEAMKEVVKFEARVAMLSFSGPVKRYARVSISKLEDAIPEFPWFEHLQSLVYPNKLSRSDPVLVLATKYLPSLFQYLNKTNNKILSNFVVWRMIKSFVPMLNQDFRKVYNRLKLGTEEDESRDDVCYSYTSKILSNLLGALFLRKRFSQDIKADVDEMMSDIIQAFEENAEKETWLSDQSKNAVRQKLKNVLAKVGYPDYLWNEPQLTARYKGLDIQPDQWFQNVVSSQKFLNYQELHRVGEVVDRKQWIAPPQMVNAFYVLTKNEIVIPAGILQEPFFYSGSIPRALSYGAIGHILGHELTHGFDDQGRSFDKFGKKVSINETGWSEISDKNFKKKSECLVKQFNNYKVLKTHRVDGNMTLGENIADAGGVKLAFNAYQRWIRDHGQEKVLPLLNKTSEQLFFIGFAQKSCTHTSPVGQYMAVKEDDHAPAKFRVIGTLVNMKEFSETFKCPLGSEMNPPLQCDVW